MMSVPVCILLLHQGTWKDTWDEHLSHPWTTSCIGTFCQSWKGYGNYIDSGTQDHPGFLAPPPPCFVGITQLPTVPRSAPPGSLVAPLGREGRLCFFLRESG